MITLSNIIMNEISLRLSYKSYDEIHNQYIAFEKDDLLIEETKRKAKIIGFGKLICVLINHGVLS